MRKQGSDECYIMVEFSVITAQFQCSGLINCFHYDLSSVRVVGMIFNKNSSVVYTVFHVLLRTG